MIKKIILTILALTVFLSIGCSNINVENVQEEMTAAKALKELGFVRTSVECTHGMSIDNEWFFDLGITYDEYIEGLFKYCQYTSFYDAYIFMSGDIDMDDGSWIDLTPEEIVQHGSGSVELVYKEWEKPEFGSKIEFWMYDSEYDLGFLEM